VKPAAGNVYTLSARIDRLSALALIAACLVSAPPAAAQDLIGFAAPDFLHGPSVSRSAFGTTYVYTGQPPHPASELQLTVVAVPAALKEQEPQLPARCLAAFVDELRARDPGLMLGSTTTRATAGPLMLVERRWLSQRGARMMTGVTACGLHRGFFVSVNFADDLGSAVQSFPALRAALGRLEVRF